MRKLLALLDVFRKGKMVANPVAWKTGQITGSIIAGLLASLIALAKVFGYELPITDDQVIAIGSAVIAIVGLFISPAITVASTDKIGLQSEHSATRDAQRIVSGS